MKAPNTLLCVSLDKDDLPELADLLNPLLQPLGVMLVTDNDPPSHLSGTINLMAMTIDDFNTDRYNYTNITKDK